MDKTIKLLAVCSVVALTTACTSTAYSPYNETQANAASTTTTQSQGNYNNYAGGVNKAPVTHSHGGKVHSHALPATGLNHTHAIGGGGSYGGNYTGGYTAPTYHRPQPHNNTSTYSNTNTGYNQPGSVVHAHCGRAHAHPLPPEGLAHVHNNVSCPGAATAGTVLPQNAPNTIANNINTYGPRPNTPVRPPVVPAPVNGNNYGSGDYYDFMSDNSNGNTAGNPNTTSNNNYYSYGSGDAVSSGSYYDNIQPKPPANYYDNSVNSNYDYSGGGGNSTPSRPSASGNTAGTGSFAPNNYSGGSNYTVQKGDTVFQVMRNTGIYWKDIIRLNNLQAPNYQINPGQVLKVR